MKLLTILLFFSLSAYAQNKYTIEVNISNSSGKKIYLSNAYGGPLDRSSVVHIDSTYAVNDTCIFKGVFNDHQYYSIAVGSKKNYAPFIIDTGKTIITGNANDYLWKSFVAVSAQNDWEMDVRKTVDTISRKREQLRDSMLKYQHINKKLSLNYVRLMNEEDTALMNFLLAYTQKYPDCYFCFFTIKSHYNFSKDAIKLAKRAFPYFSPKIRNSDEGRYLHYLLFETDKNEFSGKDFPAIDVYTVEKKVQPFKLNKNFIYFIDYLASWCVPCIANFPTLKKYEHRFGIKGFKILSISLDNNHQNWIAALKKHNITWEHYRDLDAFNSADAKRFAINEIPFMVLVGKDGKIIKMNPSNNDVESYLLKL